MRTQFLVTHDTTLLNLDIVSVENMIGFWKACLKLPEPASIVIISGIFGTMTLMMKSYLINFVYSMGTIFLRFA